MNVFQKILFRLYLAACFADWRLLRLLRKRILENVLNVNLDNLVVDCTVKFTGIECLKIGKNVSIHHWSYISADGGLNIGNDVAIGHNCTILTTGHRFDDPLLPIRLQPLCYNAVNISDDVWIGANVTILSGVSIGPRTVIAAGAVVKHSFPEGHAVIGGVPAKILKKL